MKARNVILTASVAIQSVSVAAHAAIAPPSQIASCENKIANLYLAGTFQMPASGEQMTLWVGKAKDSASGSREVVGLVGRAGQAGCEAQCRVTRFERFAKDRNPALLELDCEGARIRTMRMPLHVQWARESDGLRPTIRMGSAIYGMEQAPLRVQVNRYLVADSRGEAAGISAVKKERR